MHIDLSKFGTTLVSRPSGKEAFLALKSQLTDLKKDEKIELDFSLVKVLTPSWADEFVTPLIETYGNRIILLNTENLSVQATLKILKKSKETPVKA
jgi:hypothetical protein